MKAGLLFGPPVIIEEMDPRLSCEPLHPDEEAMVRRAVESRRRQFSAGRACARRALARLGIEDFPLINGTDRAPIWPAGVAGSISHTKSWCAVGVARQQDVRALGLDVESDAPLKTELWDTVCVSEELEWIGAQASGDRGRLAKLVFSAKECAYKCQYAITRTFLGFDAMQVTIDRNRSVFEARFCRTVDPEFRPGDVIAGRYRFFDEGLVVTAASLMPM